MNKKISTFALVLLSIFALQSCDKAAQFASMEEDSLSQADFRSSEAVEEDAGLTFAWAFGDANGSDEKPRTFNGEPSVVDFDKSEEKEKVEKIDKSKIIRNSWIQIELKDYNQGKHQIFQVIDKLGAFVSKENEQKETYRIQNELEIKIPNHRFDDLISQLTAVEAVLHIDSKRTNAKDVGEEYYDLEARIKAKKEVEARYLDILKRARTIPDVLSVEEKLRVIREEIEARQGRLRYLKDQISRSTVYLTIYQNLDYTAPRPERRGFLNKFGSALVGGWNAILDFIIGLGYLWPVWLVLGGLFYLWKTRRIRGIFRRKKD